MTEFLFTICTLESWTSLFAATSKSNSMHSKMIVVSNNLVARLEKSSRLQSLVQRQVQDVHSGNLWTNLCQYIDTKMVNLKNSVRLCLNVNTCTAIAKRKCILWIIDYHVPFDNILVSYGLKNLLVPHFFHKYICTFNRLIKLTILEIVWTPLWI